MGILIDQTTKIVVQGITGKTGSLHTKLCLEYGSKIVGGVTPGKGGGRIYGLPIYDHLKEAKEELEFDTSLIFVPAKGAKEAILEAVEAEIKLIICITEGIPVMDMLEVKEALRKKPFTRLVGPNSPGIITPGECLAGIMPGQIHKKGEVGVMSRSGTLTYEAVWQMTKLGIGQSSCIGIGGDPLIGTNFIDALALFAKDAQTKAILMIGEIGGEAEEKAAEFIKKEVTKPVFAFIAGKMAPPGRRMGHAGAIISSGQGTAISKIEALRAGGVTIIDLPTQIGITLKNKLDKL